MEYKYQLLVLNFFINNNIFPSKFLQKFVTKKQELRLVVKSRFETFAKIFEKNSAIYVNFRKEIVAKTKLNFRENAKAKIFISTLVNSKHRASIFNSPVLSH
jgi:hypothetical protein